MYLLVPGDINTRTGGYRYDKRIMQGLRAMGRHVELISLEGAYPFPNAAELEQAGAQLAALPDQALTVIDGLAYSVMPEQLARHQNRLRLVALIHHPLALETGNSRATSEQLMQSEKAALRYAQRVITTSQSTADSLRDYQVPDSAMVAVCPGTDIAPLARGASPDSFNLLCVATLTQRKAHDVLLEAMAQLKELPWHLTCAGSLERDADTAQALLRQCHELDLGERVSFTGEADEATLNALYQQADLFVLASYHEGYGMVLVEAIARGLPIVASDAGAIPSTIPTGAGILVSPGNATALAEALRQFMQDDVLRQSLQNAAKTARTSLQSWEQSTREFEAALTW
ncbi:Mannosylfructose-phosphate synthase [Granulosicoccus antarcticus IMCC3135]|uniref:Mannosylfructose-phosphate synthase n=1 Tax=Granulosicoccus antarcticus IMCC3135 TaxID=1192854 RepID=A0A2Z2NR36_9GAMM|nr:Mannosylfructose-phosphate synthase [Granulosicoccus antarcticus IMCC3135]